jgi:predicted GIY-YIG superfamily endonuclease
MKFCIEKEFEKCAGIYLISGGSMPYIGSTKNLKNRFSNHRSCLRGGYHGNSVLQNSFNKNGEDAFSFELLEVCENSREALLEAEEKWIKKFGFENLSNILEKPDSPEGVVRSSEFKSRVSLAKGGTGKPGIVKRKKYAVRFKGKYIGSFPSLDKALECYNSLERGENLEYAPALNYSRPDNKTGHTWVYPSIKGNKFLLPVWGV